jgi:hypothetical protein
MPIHDVGRLLAADEMVCHQIADTFATVRESERQWTEKLWCAIASRDGSVAVDLGIGKYINRNVMDGFGGVSRGHEQWTVRASRELSPDPDKTVIGPVHYEVIEPLKKVRLYLAENEAQPIAFDLVFEGIMQPFFEERHRFRTHFRVASDVVRYHQGGTASGWLKLQGMRIDVSDWVAARDHSWGMRDQVGTPLTDLQPAVRPAGRTCFHWTPWVFTRPDGSHYEIMQYIISNEAQPHYSGYVNHADGRQERIVRSEVIPAFDPGTRELRRATFKLHMESGEIRTVESECQGLSGFRLTTAGYGGWAKAYHGVWKGEFHVEGDYVENCLKHPEIGMVRDRPTKVREGDAVGWGIHEYFYMGGWPEFGIGPDVPERRPV